MYNAELKTRFIQSFSSSITVRRACVSLFNSLQKYEEKWNADFCTRSVDEVESVVNEYATIRGLNGGINVSILHAYVKWCVDNGVDGARDSVSGVNLDAAWKIRRQMVANPTHLQRVLDQVFDPEDAGTVDNLYRCFYWLAYAGLPEDAIMDVRASDFDRLRLFIVVNGEEYPLCREAAKSVRFSADSPTLTILHAHYETKVDRAPGDRLMRSSRGDMNLKPLRVSLSRAFAAACESGKTETTLSYYRVWLSGVFIRAQQREIAGFPTDFESVARQSVREGDEAKIRRAVRDYERDYAVWKHAFTPSAQRR